MNIVLPFRRIRAFPFRLLLSLALIASLSWNVRQLIHKWTTAPTTQLYNWDVMVIPQSNQVAAGMPHQVRIYPILKDPNITFRSEIGTLERTQASFATLSISKDSLYKPRLIASAELPNGQNLQLDRAFPVHTPQILLGESDVKYLYKNCLNPLYFRVPELDESVQLDVVAAGAHVKPSDKEANLFAIYPTQNKCALKVGRETPHGFASLQLYKFRVLDLPSPQIVWQVNGQRVSNQAPLRKGSKLAVRIIADEAFATQLPQDAIYRVGEVRVYLHSMGGQAKLINTLKDFPFKRSGHFPIAFGEKINQVKSGTKITLELSKVYRRTGTGKWVLLPLSNEERAIRLVLR